jgi:hypothetical protein
MDLPVAAAKTAADEIDGLKTGQPPRDYSRSRRNWSWYHNVGMWPFRRKRGRGLFRTYELAIVDALRAALPGAAVARYDRQIEAVEDVSGYHDDREVVGGPLIRGDHVDPEMAFANRSLECKLATLGLRGSIGGGKVTVTAVHGLVAVYTFRPAPRDLGSRASILVTDTTLHVDPMKPDDGGSVRARLDELAPSIRAELEAAWAERPDWASAIVEPDGTYRIDLDDGTYLVLAQLEDTTFIVAATDPPRQVIRRYDPDGDLVGEFASVRAAVEARAEG